MAVVSIEQALAGKVAAGSEVTVRGWVRTRRDSKAGLSFVNVSDGSCFAPIQVVAPAALANYENEVKHLTAGRPLDLEFHRNKWNVIDRDATLLDRRDEIIFVPFPLEHGSKQLHQRRPADRGLEIEPGAVGGDAHIEVAAERRIP